MAIASTKGSISFSTSGTSVGKGAARQEFVGYGKAILARVNILDRDPTVRHGHVEVDAQQHPPAGHVQLIDRLEAAHSLAQAPVRRAGSEA